MRNEPVASTSTIWNRPADEPALGVLAQPPLPDGLGKTYRVTRTFGKKAEEDTFELLDLSTNLESEDYSSKLGLELFDMDSDTFRRTVFVGQDRCSAFWLFTTNEPVPLTGPVIATLDVAPLDE